jgi:hypothetical protein
MVLNSPVIVSKIAYCLHTSNDKLRTNVAEMLAAICVLSGEHGYKMTLAAMVTLSLCHDTDDSKVDFKAFYNERYRFEYLVQSIIENSSTGKSLEYHF